MSEMHFGIFTLVIFYTRQLIINDAAFMPGYELMNHSLQLDLLVGLVLLVFDHEIDRNDDEAEDRTKDESDVEYLLMKARDDGAIVNVDLLGSA